MIRWGALVFLSVVAVASPAWAQWPRLDNDCLSAGKQNDGSFQFLPFCSNRSESPDGKFAVVQKVYGKKQPVVFQDAQGRTVTKLRSLSDEMPFALTWTPDSRLFYVNHHVGSFMDVLQVFRIVKGRAVETPALVEAARSIAVHRYPCLPRESILPNGAGLSRDGKRIIIVTLSAPYACKVFGLRPGTFKSLWMIGDLTTGRIAPGTIRVQDDDKPFTAPKDGPYADF